MEPLSACLTACRRPNPALAICRIIILPIPIFWSYNCVAREQLVRSSLSTSPCQPGVIPETRTLQHPLRGHIGSNSMTFMKYLSRHCGNPNLEWKGRNNKLVINLCRFRYQLTPVSEFAEDKTSCRLIFLYKYSTKVGSVKGD